MPTPTFRVRSAAQVLLCSCLFALSFASLAEAAIQTTPADLRVVDSKSKTLAEGTQLTGPVKLETSRKADCFGPGTGGSGDRVAVSGSTALGQLANAATIDDRIDPLGVTDFFDFGLGICRIGSAVAPSTGYWYLKVNHAASFAGADQTQISRGDEILWYLIDDFNDPIPDELALRAPATAKPGVPFAVKVRSYADNGDVSPATGVDVTGAAAPTDAEGRTTVTLDRRTAALRATRAGSIPSNAVTVCTAPVGECPPGYGGTVGGTRRADRITGGAGAERILAGAGKDEIDARRGAAPDRINCGPGRDRLIISRGTSSKFSSCEQVKRRG